MKRVLKNFLFALFFLFGGFTKAIIKVPEVKRTMSGLVGNHNLNGHSIRG
jgi:hypothetical protein